MRTPRKRGVLGETGAGYATPDKGKIEMIDQTEFDICGARGHDTTGSMETYWVKCKWCGAWVREVRITKIEIREDDPPVDEQSPLHRKR